MMASVKVHLRRCPASFVVAAYCPVRRTREELGAGSRATRESFFLGYPDFAIYEFINSQGIMKN
jgi:hypothetical protein